MSVTERLLTRVDTYSTVGKVVGRVGFAAFHM